MTGLSLHTYVEARLGRWVRWYHWGARPGPKPVTSWYGPMIIDRNVEQLGRRSTSCEVDIDEAEETNTAVNHLPHELRDTIHETYLRGGTVKQKCRALGLKRRESYYARLTRAYNTLLGYLNDLSVGVPLPPIQPSVKQPKSVRNQGNSKKPLKDPYNSSTFRGTLA